MKPKCLVLGVFSILALVILADQYSRSTPMANSEYALRLSPEHAVGLSNVVQKAESYMSKEHKEGDWEICEISYHRIYMKSKNTKISEVKDKEYYWVWAVSFIRRKNIGKKVGGGRTVVMADTPNLDLIKIQRGK